MKGWFDAFRSDGGPTLYSYSNRTPVTGDVTILALYIIFFTIFLAFLVIFPGVRKERFTTFTSVTLSLFVGTAILVSKHGSGWHVAQTDITSSYRAFSREKIAAELGAYIGLGHVNITLRAIEANRSEDVDFNERFSWHASGEMTANYREALVRGLPFPILTVAEYFSLRQEGFAWGGQYRAAGYYGSILLWASFATWVLMNLLLIVVPRYGAYCLMLTGALLLATNLVYIMLIPPEPLVVRFELGRALSFRLGWCYWLVLSAGALCVIVGLLIALIDLIYPHRFSTILEVDYDTPYDRHIIIEESHVTRTNKKKSGSRLEEPPTAGIGSRLLRRLSKRERYEDRQGVVNEGFEMDPPNSPWRYPFSRTTAGGDRIPPAAAMAARSNNRGFGFQRSESQDSQSSTCTGSSGASSLGLSFLHREHIPSVHSDPAGSTARSVSPLPKHLHHLIHQGHQDNITTTSL